MKPEYQEWFTPCWKTSHGAIVRGSAEYTLGDALKSLAKYIENFPDAENWIEKHETHILSGIEKETL